MRKCRTCLKEQPLSEFYAPSFKCKACRRAYANKRFEERIGLINRAKSEPCVDCGKKFPSCAMDFDHREQGDKFRNVSKMFSYSEIRLLEEISKCDLVCSNCHRIRTWQRGTYRESAKKSSNGFVA